MIIISCEIYILLILAPKHRQTQHNATQRSLYVGMTVRGLPDDVASSALHSVVTVLTCV
jgi:hypothetical protein